MTTKAPHKQPTQFTYLARAHTTEAVATLATIMKDPTAPPAARATAAQALLDRAWGKAPIQIDFNAKAKFDDFLRDVGVRARARQAAAAQAVTDVVAKAALDDQGRSEDENDGASED